MPQHGAVATAKGENKHTRPEMHPTDAKDKPDTTAPKNPSPSGVVKLAFQGWESVGTDVL